MKKIIKNVILPDEYGYKNEKVSVLIDGKFIKEINKNIESKDAEIIDGKGNLLIPAFYNSHCHCAMTLFRGYGEDLALMRWLNEKILPAEDLLTKRSVKSASDLAIAEMLASGIAGFSDMYMFEEETAKSVIETGIKANLTRNLVSFDDNLSALGDFRFEEQMSLYNEFNNQADGRLKIDFSLHAEYSNREKYIREVAEQVKKVNGRIQVHISETENEHNECKQRHGGLTPVKFFEKAGVLDSPAVLAHCVYVEDEDMDIIKEKGAFVSHNPKSNLKLGSGVMPLRKMLDKGICVSIGTDGTASNNTLDMIKDLSLASVLHKGIGRNAEITTSREMLKLVTKNGALAEGRDDCGEIKVGYKADLVLIDIDSVHNIPYVNAYNTLCYSANSSDVMFTMVDGEILYKNGEYTTIDIEKVKYEFKDVVEHYFD